MRSGGLAKATDKRYTSVFIAFVNWYVLMGLRIMGGKGMEYADESLWLMWLAWMAKFYAYSTIRASMFGIKHHYGLRFGFDPFKFDMFNNPIPMVRFRRALRQVKRDSVGSGRPPKFSLTKFILVKLSKYFNMRKHDDVLLWAIICLGVSCLLRWSEITLANSDYDKLLRFDDFSFTDNVTGVLALRDTKTKLFGDSMVVTFQRDDTGCCPQFAMRTWLRFRNRRSKWLFCLSDGKPVKSVFIQALLKEKLKSFNLCELLWSSGISLRKGGALTLAQCGVPDRVTQVYGRWKSNAYRVYIDMTAQEKALWNNVVRRHVLLGKPSVGVTSELLQHRVIDAAL